MKYDMNLLETKTAEKGEIAVKDLYLAGGPYYGVQEVFSRIKGVGDNRGIYQQLCTESAERRRGKWKSTGGKECVKVTYNLEK